MRREKICKFSLMSFLQFVSYRSHVMVLKDLRNILSDIPFYFPSSQNTVSQYLKFKDFKYRIRDED